MSFLVGVVVFLLVLCAAAGLGFLFLVGRKNLFPAVILCAVLAPVGLKANMVFHPTNLYPNNLVYYASPTINIGVGSSAQDFWVFPGSANKVIKIWRIYIAAWTGGAVGARPFQFLRRSSANVGGTAVPMTLGKQDRTMPDAISAPFYYSAQPDSVGTLSGTLLQLYIRENETSFVVDRRKSPWILRGASDFIVFNMNGTTQGGFQMTVEFSEEDN